MEKRIRSPNYPALSLPEAINKVTGIYRELHSHAAPREVVAKAMGYSGLSGASATAVSALHKYGLLEKVGTDEIKVSDRAMRIMHPHSPEEKASALRDAGNEPSLFAELAERFPDKMPNEELLRNYLVRKGFAPAALSAVISAYRETSEMVERENTGYDASANDTEESTPIMQTQITTPRSPTSLSGLQDLVITSDERPIGRYDYEGGAYVRIAARGDIDTEEALDMVETLIRLKREELTRKAKRANFSAPVSIASEKNADGNE